ncbi:MAG: radical SAM protein [Planctomycetota bacterium]
MATRRNGLGIDHGLDIRRQGFMGFGRVLRHAARVLLPKRDGLPLYLIHFITENCTANCGHCLVGAKTLIRDELSVDEVERISRSTGELLFMFLTGGEPFLRPDIAEIARIWYTQNRVQKFQIPSNGSLGETTVQRAREICRLCPEAHVSVSISLDAVGEAHDRSRRLPGLFERAVATYRQLKVLEKECSNFNVNVTVTVSRTNQDELEKLHDYVVNELGCGNLFNTLVRGRPTEPETLQVDIDKFEAFSDRLDADLRQARFRGYRNFPFADLVNAKNLISRKMIARTARGGGYEVPCYAGSLAAVLRSRGQLYPCELLETPIADLRQNGYDLAKAWRSEEACAIRRWIRTSKCHCTHECFVTVNILFNPRFYPRLASECSKLKWRRVFGRA